MAKRYVVLPALDTREVDGQIENNLTLKLPACPYNTRSGAISVCGNGPSLREIFPKGGPIAALNGSWRELLKHGIMPDYIIAFDPYEGNVAWFEDCPDEPLYLIAACAHPKVFEKLKGKKVCQWFLNGDKERELGLRPLIGGGFTVGCLSLNLLNLIGFTHFDIYGMDSCYGIDGAHHASPQNWNITTPQVYTVGEQSFLAEPWMAAQVEQFLEQIEQYRRSYTVDVKCGGFLKAALDHNTLEVLYDLNIAPGSFDFFCSMVNVENFRKMHGYSRVSVHFKPGQDKGFRPNEIIHLEHDYKKLMLNNVVRPLLEMFAFREVAEVSDNASLFQYTPKESLDYYRETGAMASYEPRQSALAWADHHYGDCPFVINLREAEHWPQRNSKLNEWIKFAKQLPGRVVFVRDTAKAHEPIPGFETCPEASLDIHKRLALFRNAEMNFTVTNGPSILMNFDPTIPYMQFFTDAPGYHCYAPEWLKEAMGLDGQFPWASQRQKLFWLDDTYENLMRAFSTFYPQTKAA